MTTQTDIVNQALQDIGTRTTVTDAELANNSSNEAIQANLVLTKYRDALLRMAPWNCGMKTANLVYITSSPGTPENTSPATTLWQPGQPAPPWGYEYQYPVDCLKPCWVIPATMTGFSGVPITTAVTGGSPTSWLGTPVKFKVQNDQFRPVTGATVAPGGAGSGFNPGDIITLPLGPTTSPPIGAPAQLVVNTVVGPGQITSVGVVNVVLGSSPPVGGSYFGIQPEPIPQASTTGIGTGGIFTLTQGPIADQRVILTNQEFAILSYVRQVTDPNVMDQLFLNAWVAVLGSKLAMALTGDKGIANQQVGLANNYIAEARKADGNEGLTINDVTPDFIRIRGVNYTEWYSGPYSSGFDWGMGWSSF